MLQSGGDLIMSSYTSPIEYESIGNGYYKNLSKFRFYYSDDGCGEYVEVPVGFISNGASIPTIFKKLFKWEPDDKYWIQASFLHDGLVGESSIYLPVVNDCSLSTRYLSWNEAAEWFNKALQVKQEKYPECPKVNRVLFVKSVKVWGFVKLVTAKLKLSFLDKF